MNDYTLFIRNNRFREVTHGKLDYVYFASITKFIVLLGFLKCIENTSITVNSRIKEYFQITHMLIHF